MNLKLVLWTHVHLTQGLTDIVLSLLTSIFLNVRIIVAFIYCYRTLLVLNLRLNILTYCSPPLFYTYIYN